MIDKFIKKILFVKYFKIFNKNINNKKMVKNRKVYFSLKYFFKNFKKIIFLKFEKYALLKFAINYYLNFILKNNLKRWRKMINNFQFSHQNLSVAKNYYLIRKIKFFFINLKSLIKINFKIKIKSIKKFKK
jgi:hypothetical protein